MGFPTPFALRLGANSSIEVSTTKTRLKSTVFQPSRKDTPTQLKQHPCHGPHPPFFPGVTGYEAAARETLPAAAPPGRCFRSSPTKIAWAFRQRRPHLPHRRPPHRSTPPLQTINQGKHCTCDVVESGRPNVPPPILPVPATRGLCLWSCLPPWQVRNEDALSGRSRSRCRMGADGSELGTCPSRLHRMLEPM